MLVRPSYVLGGRAMEIVYNDDDLRDYMRYAADVSDGAPILVDRYIVGKEAEVDVIADGQGGCLLPGIMEHIERAGVHSRRLHGRLPAADPRADRRSTRSSTTPRGCPRR